ncbi:repressor [Serratia marcescens]|nr:repressor [Serratia marcescens]
MKNENSVNQWLTPKNITELPGMPGSIQGVHKRAKREGWLKRPVKGRQGAGVEYLLGGTADDSKALEPQNTANASVNTQELLRVLESLINKLTSDEVDTIARNIALHGIGGLMHQGVGATGAVTELLDALGLRMTDIKLARLLNEFPEQKRREILSNYDEEKHGDPSASLTPHSTGKAG